jgi:hypothetical protein
VIKLLSTAAATATLGWNQLLNAAIKATPSPPRRPFRYTFLLTCGSNHQQQQQQQQQQQHIVVEAPCF